MGGGSCRPTVTMSDEGVCHIHSRLDEVLGPIEARVVLVPRRPNAVT